MTIPAIIGLGIALFITTIIAATLHSWFAMGICIGVLVWMGVIAVCELLA